MDERETTLAIELLVNHVAHLRSHVEILQEQLERLRVIPAESVDRELDENWSVHGDQAVDAFWDEFEKIKRQTE